MIFVTLMLPVPVRIVSTYEVIGTLGWVNTYWGLTVPLMASATATFLFRQFYLTIPDELAEAAQLDGAGPHALPVVVPPAAVVGEHRRALRHPLRLRLEPVPVAADDHDHRGHAHRGHRAESLIPRSGTAAAEWNVIMAAAMMALLPPVAVIVLMQRWFVKGLVESEK